MHSIVFVAFILYVPCCLGISICPTREITASNGRITSPGYPNKYPSNTDCTLTIKQPLDTKFTFTFSKMDIEGDDDDELSCYDQLVIKGLTQKEFCGTKLPVPYTPKINVIELKMESDGSVEQTGFDLTFSTVRTTGLPTPISVCPTRSVDASLTGGRIMSPNFPEDYGNNLDCKLTLNIPPNKKTEIMYGLFAVEYSAGCANDKLRISSSGGNSKIACGSGEVSTAVFEGDKVHVHFTTSASNTNRGFMLSYKLLDVPTSSVVVTPAPTPTSPAGSGCACPNGNQYIKRPLASNNIVKRQNDDFVAEFKTTEPNGLILYSKGQFRDFILLKLENGNAAFEVNLGTGNVSVKAPSGSLNDGAWHKVEVTRRSKSVTVTVDSYSQGVGITPGSFTKLDIKGPNAALYALGGPSGIPFPYNFKGCVRKLSVDGMNPIEDLQNNKPEYTLYGVSVMTSCNSS